MKTQSRIGAATAAFLGYTAVMLAIEQRLGETGGPGIVAFELAGDAERASDMMARWGSRGQRLARLSLRLDFGYMLSYGALAALLVDRARHRLRHPRALPLLVAGAVIGDAVEGVSLLSVLDGRDIGQNAHRARAAASIKFALLGVSLAYATVGNAGVRRAAVPSQFA